MDVDLELIEKMVPHYKEVIEFTCDDEDRQKEFTYSQDAEFKIRLDLVVFIQSIGEEMFDKIQVVYGDYDCGWFFYKMFPHDFFLSRNHHGTGFFDSDYYGEHNNFLTEKSHQMGEQYYYFGDDGLVYLA